MRGRSKYKTVNLQPALHPRLLLELSTHIYYFKIQDFASNLTFKFLSSATPATKSNTKSIRNIVYGRKNHAGTLPNIVPATKRNTHTLPNTTPGTKNNTLPLAELLSYTLFFSTELYYN